MGMAAGGGGVGGHLPEGLLPSSARGFEVTLSYCHTQPRASQFPPLVRAAADGKEPGRPPPPGLAQSWARAGQFLEDRDQVLFCCCCF